MYETAGRAGAADSTGATACGSDPEYPVGVGALATAAIAGVATGAAMALARAFGQVAVYLRPPVFAAGAAVPVASKP